MVRRRISIRPYDIFNQSMNRLCCRRTYLKSADGSIAVGDRRNMIFKKG
jgi:hypothetical protein